MSLPGPQGLGAAHVVEGFDCGKPALDEWLVRHARQAQASGSGRVFVLAQARQVVAYYSLTVGQVERLQAPERVAKGMGHYPIPVVILARLAVDRRWQGRGLGAFLLQDAIRRTLAIADQVGVLALLVHPLDDAAAAFYGRFGFSPSPLRERQLLLLLKDARRFA